MALLGPTGIETLAIRNAAACQVARNGVLSLKGVELLYPKSSSYNEFTVVLPGSAKSALSHLDSLGVTGGLALKDTILQASDKWLHITATDQTTEDDVAALVEGLKSWISSFAQEMET